jgi:lipoprotein-anchoring transpeptidase ErfK/SrfK
MNLRLSALIAALLASTAVPAGYANAQIFGGPAPVYREAPPSNHRLPPSWQVDDEDEEPTVPSAPGLPRSVGPTGQAPMPQGYYPSSQPFQPQGPAIARQPAEVDVVRPPSDVGARPAAPGAAPAQQSVASLPPEDQPETGEPKVLDPKFKKQLVDYRGSEPAGTIIIDTSNKFLFLTLGGGKSLRYGIGVGRDGFTWAGSERVSRMAEWPDWHPPAEMIERQPYLPRMMAGGNGNPLGARALYLGKTLYRIHGTNQPSTIGSNVSSGCIRLLNEDIEDLYSRVQVGTRVVVLPNAQPVPTAQNPATPTVPAPMHVGSNGPTGSISSAPLPALR